MADEKKSHGGERTEILDADDARALAEHIRVRGSGVVAKEIGIDEKTVMRAALRIRVRKVTCLALAEHLRRLRVA